MKIEVAVPCYNEEPTIEKVVRDFSAALPEAEIVVYDNNSTDGSAAFARKAGARVVRVNRQGKGYVVEKVFELSQADIVVMVDGDDTYEARDVNQLIEPLGSGSADMTIGTRLHFGTAEFGRTRYFGNRVLTWMLNTIFRTHYQDILSGYRAFNRRFVENIPITSGGFQVETELIIQALEDGMVVKEIPIGFRQRPPGSESKLSAFRDGYHIILMIIASLRDHRPLLAFTVVGLLSVCIGVPIWVIGFLYAAGNNLLSVCRSVGTLFIILAVGLFLVGLILNTINTRMREQRLLMKRKRR